MNAKCTDLWLVGRQDLGTETVDITLDEMRAWLRDEHDLTVGLGTLWSFLDARDLTYKNRQLTPQSKIART